jgi:hypothetical protein
MKSNGISKIDVLENMFRAGQYTWANYSAWCLLKNEGIKIKQEEMPLGEDTCSPTGL